MEKIEVFSILLTYDNFQKIQRGEIDMENSMTVPQWKFAPSHLT